MQPQECTLCLKPFKKLCSEFHLGTCLVQGFLGGGSSSAEFCLSLIISEAAENIVFMGGALPMSKCLGLCFWRVCCMSSFDWISFRASLSLSLDWFPYEWLWKLARKKMDIKTLHFWYVFLKEACPGWTNYIVCACVILNMQIIFRDLIALKPIFWIYLSRLFSFMVTTSTITWAPFFSMTAQPP